ncbi:hypothetical protein SAMN05216570_0744 [Dyella sp. OK004]|uniref:hypothetical protein n=1 Tax=Dyella sp. OK004 TaxID=1855292 RepID=UPI0008F12861|nr:hypothetical protein [Dyella sp. OK004]SFR92855.1 hypothetical protein SAMN05216570_0744 [Dyella sp. OK004]
MSASHAMRSAFGSRSLFLLVALLGITFSAFIPANAHANVAVCAIGNHQANWAPGVTNTVAMHTVTTDTSWTCTQLLTPYSLIATASSHEQFSAPFSCSNLFSTAPITWTIHWQDGGTPSTSSFTFTATVIPQGGNLVVTAPGSITAGRYSGRTAEAEFILLNLGATLNNLCSSPAGVANASGPATLTIL